MWTLSEAIPLIQKIAPIAKRHGFSVALYGSVLEKGSGDDLDLFFVTQDDDICDVQGSVSEIGQLSGIRSCGEIHWGRGAFCIIHLQNGERIDAQFRDLLPQAARKIPEEV